MKNNIVKIIIFVYVVLISQIILLDNTYAGDILSKFVFDWDGVFFMQPRLNEVVMYNNQFMIKWEEIEDVDGYIIYRKVDNKKWKKIDEIKGSGTNWYFDKDIKSTKVYDYTVSAYRIKDNVKLVSRRDMIGVSYLQGPVIISLDDYKIKWEKCKRVDGYELYYREDNSDKWVKFKTLDKNKTTCTLGGIYKKDRYYKVKAYYKNERKKVYSKGEEDITYKYRSYEDTKILFEGDDILIGKKGEDNRLTLTERIEDFTNAQVKVNAYKSKTVKDIIKGIEKDDKYFKGYDIICLAVGNSDYMENVKMGKVTDVNKKTFMGQLNYIIKKIEKQNKKAKIVLITPFYRGKFKDKEKINCYVYDNKKDYTLDDYGEAARQIAFYRDTYLYDTEKEGVVNVDNVEFMTTDYVYLTSLAHGKMGCSLVKYLVEYGCLEEK